MSFTVFAVAKSCLWCFKHMKSNWLCEVVVIVNLNIHFNFVPWNVKMFQCRLKMLPLCVFYEVPFILVLRFFHPKPCSFLLILIKMHRCFNHFLFAFVQAIWLAFVADVKYVSNACLHWLYPSINYYNILLKLRWNDDKRKTFAKKINSNFPMRQISETRWMHHFNYP